MTTFLLTVVLLLGIALSRAYALTVLWGWFIVPAFSVPAIGMLTAFGVTFMLTMLLNHPSEYHKKSDFEKLDKEKTKEIVYQKFVESLMLPWCTLGSAWLILKIAVMFGG